MRMIRTIMDAKITSNIYCICMSFDTATSDFKSSLVLLSVSLFKRNGYVRGTKKH